MSIVTKITLVFSFLVFMISALVGYISYSAGSRLLEETEIAHLKQTVQLVEREFAIVFEGIGADVLFLSDIPALKYIAEYHTEFPIPPNTPLTENQLLSCSAGTFMGFMNNRDLYTQTRFIGRAQKGLELVRVERHKDNDSINIKKEALQSKAHRDYFQKTIHLNDNELYLSPIDLNREHGVIEEPHSPTVRVATPIYSANQNSVGLLVINVAMQKLFAKIQQNLPDAMKLYIANSQGDYLIHPDTEKTFGFEFGQPYKMQEEFPFTKALLDQQKDELARSRLKQDNNSDELNFSYFSSIQLSPEKFKQRRLYVGVLLPYKTAVSGKQGILNDSVRKAVLLCSLGVLFTFIFAVYLTRPLKYITIAVSRFAKGEHDVDLCLNRTDEIGELARTCQMMANQIRWQLLRLEDEKHRLQTIFDTAVEGIVVINEQGVIESVNHTMEKLFGYQENELIGQNINILMPKDFRSKHTHIIERYVDTNVTYVVGPGREVEALHKNGSVLPLHVGVSELWITHERKFVGMMHDISQRKQAEQAVLAERDRAESANRAKSSFLANMSHEFRTPLNGILGYTQLLRRDTELLPTQREQVNVIHRSGEHLLALINDILDLSKIEAEHLEIIPDELNFPALVKDIVYLFKARAAQKHIDFICQDVTSLPNGIYADGKRLRQVLINLLGNAIKFTEHGSVTFQVAVHNDQQCFDIIDTGAGIPDADLDNIFNPFHQVENQRQRSDGTGLGLTITRRLIDMMDGTIHVDSQEGFGSHFQVIFNFPVLQKVTQLTEKEHRQVIGCMSDTPYTLLIVDDKKDNRQLLAHLLMPLGFSLIEAKNGQVALELLKQHSIDLVLLDLFMPVLDGFATTQAIRSHPDKQDLPIIAVSAGVFSQQRQQALACGCNDFLEKPINTEDLLQCLQQHLELEWLFEADAPPTDHLTPPPPVDIEILKQYLPQLKDCARHGDIQGVLDLIEALPPLAAQSELFTQARQLTEDIDMQALRYLLDQSMD